MRATIPTPSWRREPPDALCEDCGEPTDMTDVNVEAFEVTGRLICAECFAELHEGEEGDCCPGCGACPGFTGVECDETCEWATTGGGAA